MSKSFMQLARSNSNLNLEKELENQIDLWHESFSQKSLREFLGFTYREYDFFLRDADYLEHIIKGEL